LVGLANLGDSGYQGEKGFMKLTIKTERDELVLALTGEEIGDIVGSTMARQRLVERIEDGWRRPNTLTLWIGFLNSTLSP
jgi:hypothetical protein